VVLPLLGEELLDALDFTVSRWHEQIGDPAIADGILDRLVHNAHRFGFPPESTFTFTGIPSLVAPAAVYEFRGLAYFGLWDFDACITDQQQILALMPDNAEIHTNLATLFVIKPDRFH